MPGGQFLGTILGFWLGMFCSLAAAQPSFPEVTGPAFPRPMPSEPAGPFHFGLMGQIARPGVYEVDQPEPQLVELIGLAGGLTGQANNQIRIVRQGHAGQVVFYSPGLYFPLLPGDIVVADGPMTSISPHRVQITPRPTAAIRNADYEEEAFTRGDADSLRQVALMNVLDRPVILPVPDQHANLPAVLKYLGQDPAIASEVKVLPIGPARVSDAFVAPTILYFPPQLVERERLPAFPEVRRVALAAPKPRHQFQTAEAPLPHEQFQRPELAEESPTTMEFPRPPMTARIPESEPAIPLPFPLESREPARTNEAPIRPPVSDAFSNDDTPAEIEPEESSSGWTTAGWVLLVLTAGGFYGWRKWQSWVDSEWEFTVTEAFTAPASGAPEPTPEIKPQTKLPSLPGLGDLMSDEVLAALMFNQLPVVEEDLLESMVSEPQPNPTAPATHIRVDPPHVPTRIKTPHTARPAPVRPEHVNPAPPAVLAIAPKNLPAAEMPRPPETEPPKGLGLLDRVLQQVHQNRAA